jgi:hypothetical protein
MSEPLFTDADRIAMDRLSWPDIDACANTLIVVAESPNEHATEMISGLFERFEQLGFDRNQIINRILKLYEKRKEFWNENRPFNGGSEMRVPFTYEANK